MTPDLNVGLDSYLGQLLDLCLVFTPPHFLDLCSLFCCPYNICQQFSALIFAIWLSSYGVCLGWRLKVMG